MSLILEALRKREREKQAPERGFLVMAETPWTPARGLGVWAIVTAAALAFGLGAAFASLHPLARSSSAQIAPAATLAATPRMAMPAAPFLTLLPGVARATPAPVTPEAPSSLPGATLASAPPSPTATRLVLQAISERDGQPVALISDHLLHEGDSLDGARLLHIGETEVELEQDSQRLTLRFQ